MIGPKVYIASASNDNGMSSTVEIFDDQYIISMQHSGNFTFALKKKVTETSIDFKVYSYNGTNWVLEEKTFTETINGNVINFYSVYGLSGFKKYKAIQLNDDIESQPTFFSLCTSTVKDIIDLNYPDYEYDSAGVPKYRPVFPKKNTDNFYNPLKYIKKPLTRKKYTGTFPSIRVYYSYDIKQDMLGNFISVQEESKRLYFLSSEDVTYPDGTDSFMPVPMPWESGYFQSSSYIDIQPNSPDCDIYNLILSNLPEQKRKAGLGLNYLIALDYNGVTHWSSEQNIPNFAYISSYDDWNENYTYSLFGGCIPPAPKINNFFTNLNLQNDETLPNFNTESNILLIKKSFSFEVGGDTGLNRWNVDILDHNQRKINFEIKDENNSLIASDINWNIGNITLLENFIEDTELIVKPYFYSSNEPNGYRRYADSFTLKVVVPPEIIISFEEAKNNNEEILFLFDSDNKYLFIDKTFNSIIAKLKNELPLGYNFYYVTQGGDEFKSITNILNINDTLSDGNILKIGLQRDDGVKSFVKYKIYQTNANTQEKNIYIEDHTISSSDPPNPNYYYQYNFSIEPSYGFKKYSFTSKELEKDSFNSITYSLYYLPYKKNMILPHDLAEYSKKTFSEQATAPKITNIDIMSQLSDIDKRQGIITLLFISYYKDNVLKKILVQKKDTLPESTLSILNQWIYGFIAPVPKIEVFNQWGNENVNFPSGVPSTKNFFSQKVRIKFFRQDLFYPTEILNHKINAFYQVGQDRKNLNIEINNVSSTSTYYTIDLKITDNVKNKELIFFTIGQSLYDFNFNLTKIALPDCGFLFIKNKKIKPFSAQKNINVEVNCNLPPKVNETDDLVSEYFLSDRVSLIFTKKDEQERNYTINQLKLQVGNYQDDLNITYKKLLILKEQGQNLSEFEVYDFQERSFKFENYKGNIEYILTLKVSNIFGDSILVNTKNLKTLFDFNENPKNVNIKSVIGTFKDSSESKFNCPLKITENIMTSSVLLQEDMNLTFNFNFQLYTSEEIKILFLLQRGSQPAIEYFSYIPTTLNFFDKTNRTPGNNELSVKLPKFKEILTEEKRRWTVIIKTESQLTSIQEGKAINILDFNVIRHTLPNFKYLSSIYLEDTQKIKINYLYKDNGYSIQKGTGVSSKEIVLFNYIRGQDQIQSQNLTDITCSEGPAEKEITFTENSWDTLKTFITIKTITSQTLLNLNGTQITLQNQKVFKSEDILLFSLAPTVAYRKNYLGINAKDVDTYSNSVLVVKPSSSRNHITLIGIDEKDTNNIINMDIDLGSGRIDNFIIKSGSWDDPMPKVTNGKGFIVTPSEPLYVAKGG